MRTRWLTTLRSWPVFLASLGAACGQGSVESGDSEASENAAVAAVMGSLPTDWIGHELGVPSLEARPVGQVTIVQPTSASDGQIPWVVPANRPEMPGNKLMGMDRDGITYEVVIDPAGARSLSLQARARGMLGPSQLALPPDAEKGWNYGLDLRYRWRDSANDWPRDTIGVVSADSTTQCSGALFGSRLVLTAAHCNVDGEGNWIQPRFRAGQDGTAMPYGEVEHVFRYYDQGFIDNDCHRWLEAGYTEACEKYDWAVLVLANAPTDADGNTPGYMNFMYAPSDRALAGYAKLHFGYVRCASFGAPFFGIGCVENTLWGDGTRRYCATGGFFNDVDGVNRNFWHGCDTSGGHSGAPLFSWSPGSDGPYIVATNIAEECPGILCLGKSNPNVAFRIDQRLADLMAYWRSIY